MFLGFGKFPRRAYIRARATQAFWAVRRDDSVAIPACSTSAWEVPQGLEGLRRDGMALCLCWCVVCHWNVCRLVPNGGRRMMASRV